MTDVVEPAGEASYRVTADELRSFVERYGRPEAEKRDLADQQKKVMAEEGPGLQVPPINCCMSE